MPNLIIPPRDLPDATEVFATDSFVVDNGSVVSKCTAEQIVDAGRPLATIQEAQAGLRGDRGMTPLTTAAAIAARGGSGGGAVGSYAEAVTAAQAPGISNLKMIQGGRVIEWERDPSGPCLGGGWSAVNDVVPGHFDLAANPALAIRSAMVHAAAIGADLLITRGDHVCTSSIAARIFGSLTVRFESGARLVAAPGLAQAVFYPRATAGDQATWEEIDLTVINPQIDCSAGSSPLGVGGAFCSALSFDYFRKVRVEGGYLYGGELSTNSNADSGVSWVTCGDVVVDGTRIKGFNDLAVYPGGNNSTGAAGDGGPGRVTNCLIQQCNGAAGAKREMDVLVFHNNVVEDCMSGVASQNVTDAGGVMGARRLEVTDNIFRRILANVIRPRGHTRGKATGNTIEDWGYNPITMAPAGANGNAMNLDGTVGFDWSDNTFELKDWNPDNQVAVLFSQHTFNGVTYDHSNCAGRANTYRRCPRVYGFASVGGPHTMLGEYFQSVGATPIGITNRNSATIVTYRQNDSNQIWQVHGERAQPFGPPMATITTAPLTLNDTHKGQVVNNNGATGTTVITLPPAAIGIGPFVVCQMATNPVQVQTAAGDIIRLPGGLNTTNGGAITSAARGDFVSLVAIDSTNWVCVAHGGGWTAA